MQSLKSMVSGNMNREACDMRCNEPSAPFEVGAERRRTELQLDTAKVLLLLPSPYFPQKQRPFYCISRAKMRARTEEITAASATWWEMRVFLSFRARKRQATLLSKRGFPKKKGESTSLTFQCIRLLLPFLLHLQDLIFSHARFLFKKSFTKTCFPEKKNKLKF